MHTRHRIAALSAGLAVALSGTIAPVAAQAAPTVQTTPGVQTVATVQTAPTGRAKKRARKTPPGRCTAKVETSVIRGKRYVVGRYCGKHYRGVALARLLKRAHFSKNRAVYAYAVVMSESAGYAGTWRANRDRRGRITSVDVGLFQINNRWFPAIKRIDGYNAPANARLARAIQRTSSWAPWNGYSSGHYKHYMKEARTAVRAAW